MKRFISIVLVVLTACLAFGQEKKKKSGGGGDEQALTKLEHDWSEALVKKDFALFDQITASEWILSTPDGERHTKAQALADLKSGKIKFESFKVDELKIQLYGDAAVVFGVTTEKLTVGDQAISGQNRFTDTFIKRNGKWQCVATHVTNIPPPGKK